MQHPLQVRWVLYVRQQTRTFPVVTIDPHSLQAIDEQSKNEQSFFYL